ncbi:MAG: VOC family protein [Pseudomonadota bacterium]
MKLLDLDHFVLTVASIEDTVAFYQDVLGMRPVTFQSGRFALEYGAKKINLHKAGEEFQPHAERPQPGSADLCFVVEDVARALSHVQAKGIEVFEGPVSRTGATGPITSIYFRDPDGNLIELAEYDHA